MIWHIFRKDLRLLWPLATLVAAVQFLNAVLLIGGGRFARAASTDMRELGWVSNIALPGIALLGLVILVIAAIHQDRLPGTTQDWLTRPIPRGRLFRAKLLFVSLTGLLPILVADLAMGLAEGLPITDVAAASLTRSAVLLCLVCLPAALLGVVTRTLTEALVSALFVVVVVVVEMVAVAQLEVMTLPVMQSGFSWVIPLIVILLNIGALLVLLPLQSRWRSTNRVRWILTAYFCVLPAAIFLPWDAAFQIDRAITKGNDASRVNIELDPTGTMSFVQTPHKNSLPGLSPFVTLTVPVSASNLGAGDRLFIDRVEYVASNAEFSRAHQTGYLLERPTGRAALPSQIRLTLPVDEFDRARAARSDIEVQLFATRFRRTAQKSLELLASGSATAAIDDHGRCSEHEVERLGRRVTVVECVSARPIGGCFELSDSARQSRMSLLTAFKCGSVSYAPWPLPVWRDAYYSVVLWSEDGPPFGADSSSKPQRADVIVTNYLPDGHFVRTLSFPIGNLIETSITNGAGSVDGMGPAARFAAPTSVVSDRLGNLFIADVADSVIRKVTPAGEVSTFAGRPRETGENDGVAGEARFTRPQAIAIDAEDNLFVADTGSGLIRKITPAGVVTTMAGATAGVHGGTQPLRFNLPRAIACAPGGNLYVIDFNGAGDHRARLRRISPGGVVSTVAGPDDPVTGTISGAVGNSAGAARHAP
jgi:ABC-type transport system involved in multi-copper enzyme maturation permease subunit